MDTSEVTTPSEKINEGPRFISIAELMMRTTLSRPTIYRHIKDGSIPAIKVGRRVIIDVEVLQKLKARERGTILAEEEKE
jgi:excisionase family DNA binding protein